MYEFCRIGRNLSLLSSYIAKHSCPSISHNISSHTYIYNTHYGAKKCLINLQENLKALLFIPLTFQPILSFQTKILCHVASNSFLFLVMFSATSMMVSHRRRKKKRQQKAFTVLFFYLRHVQLMLYIRYSILSYPSFSSPPAVSLHLEFFRHSTHWGTTGVSFRWQKQQTLCKSFKVFPFLFLLFVRLNIPSCFFFRILCFLLLLPFQPTRKHCKCTTLIFISHCITLSSSVYLSMPKSFLRQRIVVLVSNAVEMNGICEMHKNMRTTSAKSQF